MTQLSAQSLTLHSSLCVPLSIRLSCLFCCCSFTKSLPPATYIPQSCHFCASSISFISFASFMSFLYPSFCLFLFVLQFNCQALPLNRLFFIPQLPLPSGFLHRFFPARLFFHSLSLSGLFIALINFSAYEMMLRSTSSNFLTLSLFAPVSVPPAGGRGGTALGGKENEEKG